MKARRAYSRAPRRHPPQREKEPNLSSREPRSCPRPRRNTRPPFCRRGVPRGAAPSRGAVRQGGGPGGSHPRLARTPRHPRRHLAPGGGTRPGGWLDPRGWRPRLVPAGHVTGPDGPRVPPPEHAEHSRHTSSPVTGGLERRGSGRDERRARRGRGQVTQPGRWPAPPPPPHSPNSDVLTLLYICKTAASHGALRLPDN